MAPNLPISRPLEEELIQPPKAHRSGGDHGPHSVISTYAKKDAYQIRQFPLISTDTATKMPSEALENLETDPSKSNTKHQKNAFISDSDENYSLIDETLLQEDDLIMETTTLKSTKVKTVPLETLPLIKNRVLTMGTIPASEVYNQGFRPHANHRNLYPNPNLATYGVINGHPMNSHHPIITSNGRIYYPGGFHIAREISNHPNVRLQPLNPALDPYEFSPAFRQQDTSFPEPQATTFRPKHRKKSSKSKARRMSTTTKRTEETSTSSSDKYDSIDFDFEKVLAESSNLYHHQKSLEELARNGKNVGVREDDWLLTGEGATAIILVGMCSIIMMLICLIFMMKKCKKSKNGDKIGDEIEERKTPAAKGVSTLWLDLYNPVNLIPQISYLHTLPQVDVPKKHNSSDVPVPPAMTQRQLPYITVDDYTETNLGRLWFSVRYEPQKSNLHVNVRHARYPKGRDISNNTGEIWIEGIVLSSMNTMKATSKTNTRRATYSPVFNHSFLFLLNNDEVESCILKLALHDKHPKKEEQIVGSIILPLSSVDLTSDEIHCRDLI